MHTNQFIAKKVFYPVFCYWRLKRWNQKNCRPDLFRATYFGQLCRYNASPTQNRDQFEGNWAWNLAPTMDSQQVHRQISISLEGQITGRMAIILSRGNHVVLNENIIINYGLWPTFTWPVRLGDVAPDPRYPCILSVLMGLSCSLIPCRRVGYSVEDSWVHRLQKTNTVWVEILMVFLMFTQMLCISQETRLRETTEGELIKGRK